MGNLPASVPVDGTRRVIFIPTATNIAAVKITEANAGTFITGYLTGDGWNPTGDQATIADPRLGSSQDFEQPGRKTKTLSIRYVYNLDSEDDDEARTELAEGTTGYLLNVLQKPEEDGDTVAVGDWYEAWLIKAGEGMVTPSEANAVDRIDQRMFITGPVQKFKQFVAGP